MTDSRFPAVVQHVYRLVLAPGLATLVTVAVALRLLAGGPPAQPSGAAKPAAATDLDGDPLPPGALARLGSVRFRHAGAVHAVAFSPDGRLIAASSDDQARVVLWERASGRKLWQIPLNHILPPTYLRFSADGKRLYGSFSYGRDMQLYAWDARTGKAARDIPPLPEKVRALGYSPEGREFLLLDRDAEVVRWDIEKVKERGRHPKPGGEGYISTAALLAGRLLVPRFNGRSVGMWDAAQEKLLWSVAATRERDYPGLPMAFSADGKLFAAETPPRVISVYESLTGKKVRQIQGDVEKIFWSLAISPDARTIAGSSWDGTLRLWDLGSGKERAKVPAVEGWVTNVFFAPDSRAFATAGGNNAHGVLLWETATGKRIDPFPGHASPISCVAFSPDGRTAATASRIRGDRVVHLWELRTGRLLRSLAAPVEGGVPALAFSPDGGTLAACSWSGDSQVWLWDVRSGRMRHELGAAGGYGTCLAFSPDGKHLAAGTYRYNRRGREEGCLCHWDAESGKQLRRIEFSKSGVHQVHFTRGGRQMLVAADGVHVVDAVMGQPLGEPLQSKTQVGSLALSADGRLLATANGGSRVCLWELATRREIPLSFPVANSSDVGLSPDGRTLAARGHKGGVVLFHWPCGEVVRRLPGEGRFGMLSVFAPDGRLLVTANNAESSALVWDVAGMIRWPLPAVARPAEAELRRWWAELREESPAAAYQAVWRFVAAPEQTLPFLAGILRPGKAPEPTRVARLIAALDSADFETREKASRELEGLGDAVAEHLHKAKEADTSAEQRRRIQHLLGRVAGPVAGPEQRRAIRAVAVLEQIGSPQAQRVLRDLAAGTPRARLTQEAREALDRLRQAPQNPAAK